MYANGLVNVLVVLVTTMCVSLTVLFHYETLEWLSARMQAAQIRQRRKVLYGIYAVIAIHVAEVWIFGLAIWALLQVPGAGAVHGAFRVGLLDAVYLSAATFTTVGVADMAPVGPLRFLTGTEALTGFILIAWSASFTFLEMARFWRNR